MRADRPAARLLPTEAAVVRLRTAWERPAAPVGQRVARLDAADRAVLRAALPVLRALAVDLREEAEDS
ncbi:hypothetical protein QFZ56_000558 [Streptomyces achromogenes]|uniref:MarR family transcriptional regulator n=1 Tax=Streptomyces achromogenes TaxID=67255 RepID=A0ABU0PT75_STRAH|nr:hypothetical protein [Streptomyces achromogenes]MDQ0681595.1 hypothetical protein [Streptomyces achromogenes]